MNAMLQSEIDDPLMLRRKDKKMKSRQEDSKWYYQVTLNYCKAKCHLHTFVLQDPADALNNMDILLACRK